MPNSIMIFVEGGDDLQFFRYIIEPKLRNNYESIKYFVYRARPKNQIKSMLNTLNTNKQNYIFVTDFDNSHCMTNKKQLIQMELNPIDNTNIVIVKREIESWYLAGVDYKNARNLGVIYHTTTNDLTKEDLEKHMTKFYSTIDLKIEILKIFDLPLAITQNESFKYFVNKYLN